MLHEREDNENAASPVIGMVLMPIMALGSFCGIPTGSGGCILRRMLTLNLNNTGGCAAFPVDIRSSCATIL